MAAPLYGQDGKILMGHAPGAFQVPGVDPQNPHAIASAFASYDQNRQGAVPAQPAPPVAAQPPVVPVVPPVAAAVPGQPQPGEAGYQQPADDGSVGTSLELAKIFAVETPEDVFNSITHTVGDRQFTLQEAVDGYIAQPDAAAVVAERASLEAEFSQRDQQRQQLTDTALANMIGVTNQLRAQVTADQDPAALAQLLTEDPGKYHAKILEIEARKQMLTNAESEKTRIEEAKTRARQDDHERWLSGEFRSLQHKMPEWNNPQTGPALKTQVEAYARSIGFTDREMQGFSDHRILVALKDGAMGRAVSSKGKQALKAAKEAKLPAPVGRQAARGEVPGKQEAANQGRADAFNQLQKDHSLDSAAAVFERIA